ncbi:MAG: MBL fold metallo-hydrolase [Anaerolineales bacterium]|nr:MBL fold metallo-hydrolase [Anaerolineae bacterium]PWB50867.1 MAG: MBL fold metallo-hydrolase [Anaerolineales bacterium]
MNTYQTSSKAEIYQIQLHEFPQLIGNVYLVIFGKYRVLIDSGSGFGEANEELETGFEEVGNLRGEPITFSQLSHIFITHGHIDHFGGLPYIRERSQAKICIHELDRRIVSNHEERLSIAAHRLEEFLTEAGVSAEQRENELAMYKITKSLYRSVNVDLTYEAVGMRLGPFSFTHVPGHCAGHVIIQLHDVLFSGDHILEKTSPHQAPEQITLSTGLETYLSSLEIARKLSKKVRLTLCGHENPVYDLNGRIEEIRKVHRERLQTIIKLLTNPHTIAELSKYLFGKVEGYTILLALEEAGAHVEYLYQRGYLKIANLTEIEENPNLVPIQYQSVDCEIDNF